MAAVHRLKPLGILSPDFMEDKIKLNVAVIYGFIFYSDIYVNGIIRKD